MQKDILSHIGKSLYKVNILKEYKRYVVFRTRCMLHKKQIDRLLNFFDESEARRQLLLHTPSFVEQTTRGFFYKNSTWQERTDIVQEHILFLQNRFTASFTENIYIRKKPLVLWQNDYAGKPLSLRLEFNAGQRKEGCLSLVLHYDGEPLYQIIFWLGSSRDKNETAVHIGALQGPASGNAIVKDLTKAFFGYRTKNLIFYGLRSFASAAGIEKIFAVGNSGYYAMNHIRMNRKLKTSFDNFWLEVEGIPCEDKRFYVIPVQEKRKTMEELKPSKRAQHRRRFEKMDEILAAVQQNLQPFLK